MKRADSFYYSKAWRSLRAAVLRRDNFRCVVCRCDVSAPKAARVDHIKTRRERPDLALDIDNLRTLCAAHDNQSHREKGNRSANGDGERIERFTRRGVGADGWPLELESIRSKRNGPKPFGRNPSERGGV